MDHAKTLPAHPHLSKEVIGTVLTPAPKLSRPGEPETLKAKGQIFKNCLQNKRCSAGLQINLGSARYLS